MTSNEYKILKEKNNQEEKKQREILNNLDLYRSLSNKLCVATDDILYLIDSEFSISKNKKQLGITLNYLNNIKVLIETLNKNINKHINTISSKLVNSMVEAEESEYFDSNLNVRFKLHNINSFRQSDYAKSNEKEFAEIFKKNGFNIFSEKCNWKALEGVCKNEISTIDDIGNYILPDWALKYIKQTNYVTIKTKNK